MLSYRPGDRFQSAAAVLQALQPSTLPKQPDSNLSQVATVAVNRRSDPISSRSPDRVIPPPRDNGSGNLWTWIGLGLLSALIAGFGAWAIVSAIYNARQPEEIPAPVVETPTPTPSAEPIVSSQRLDLSPGQIFSERGNLEPNNIVNYTISGQENQQLIASLDSEGIWMTVLGPDGQLVDPSARRVQSWEGTLPRSGDYTIALNPIPGLPESEYRYTLNIRLEQPIQVEPTPTPIETIPSPEYDTEQINFPPDQKERQVQLSGQTSPNLIKRYEVDLEEGEILEVDVVEGEVTLDIRYPDGQLVENASGLREWQAQVPTEGNYQIDAIASEPTDFTLNLGIRNLDEQ